MCHTSHLIFNSHWVLLLLFFFAPTDLKTMTERLKNRYYVTKKLFIADLQRIITNCREYNPPDSEYCKCANTLEKFFYFKLKDGGLIEKWTRPQNYLAISNKTGSDFHSSHSQGADHEDSIASYCHIWVNKRVCTRGNCWTNITEGCLEISEPGEHYKVSKWHYRSP